jgi:hypothetical protein
MFTLFHLIRLIAIVAGVSYGWTYGNRLLGIAGAVVGVPLGFILGNIVGWIPERLALKSSVAKLRRLSEEELRAQIRNPACCIPNLFLLELNSRGLSIDEHVIDVMYMMRSDDAARRGFGWAALTSAFPELAKEVRGYRINDPVETCIQNTMPLEKYAQ